MPTIPKEFLECCIYLYPSGDKLHNQLGGTGFLVGRRSKVDFRRIHVYAVSNRHVVEGTSDKRAAPVIRVNHEGEATFLPTPTRSDEWALCDTDDLAAIRIDSDGNYAGRYVETERIKDVRRPFQYRADLGDEVFLVGRYVDLAQEKKNVSTVRCGNIAMLPEMLPCPYLKSKVQLSYLLELRTVPGFSGSPVFDYIPGRRIEEGTLKKDHDSPKLLGVLWTIHALSKTTDKDHFSGLSGMLPAWRLLEFLENNEKLIEDWNVAEQQIEREIRGDGEALIPASASEVEPPTKAAFEDTLKKASRKRPKRPAPSESGPKKP